MPRDASADVMYLLLFMLAPVVAFVGMRWAGVSLRRFSLPSLLVLAYLVMAYVGLLPLYMGWDSYGASLGATNPAVLGRVTAYSGIALVTMVAGFVFARHVINLRPRRAARAVLPASDRRQLAVIGVLSGLAFAALALYLRRVPSIALTHVLAGDVLGAAVARSEMTNNFAGDYWRYQLLFRHLLDFCVLYVFIEWRNRRTRALGFAFALLFSGAAFSATMSIEKGPLFALLVMLYLAHVSITDGRYWQRAALRTVPMAALLLVVLKTQFMASVSLAVAFEESIWRVFSGQIVPAYFYVDQFPREMAYLGGISFPNPGGLLPFEPISVTVKIAEVIYPDDLARGVVGSAPTVFWGEMYANFGPLGVVFSSFIVGVWIFALHCILRRLSASPSSVALTVWLGMHYRVLTGTGLSEFLFDIPAVVLAATAALLLFVRGRRLVRRVPARIRHGSPVGASSALA